MWPGTLPEFPLRPVYSFKAYFTSRFRLCRDKEGLRHNAQSFWPGESQPSKNHTTRWKTKKTLKKDKWCWKHVHVCTHTHTHGRANTFSLTCSHIHLCVWSTTWTWDHSDNNRLHCYSTHTNTLEAFQESRDRNSVDLERLWWGTASVTSTWTKINRL